MKTTKAHGRVWIKKVYKERLSQTHWLWHFIVCGENTGNFELLVKYPVGKKYTDRVTKLANAQMIYFEADVVDGEFFATNLYPSESGSSSVQIELQGNVYEVCNFNDEKKIVVKNSYGLLTITIEDDQTIEREDEVEILASIRQGKIVARRIDVKRRYFRRMHFDDAEIDEILARLGIEKKVA